MFFIISIWLKKQEFRKLALLPSSGNATKPALRVCGLLGGANLYHRTEDSDCLHLASLTDCVYFYLTMEADPSSKMFSLIKPRR
jgi:hypothetical protein